MNIEITTSETLDSNIEIVRYPGQAAKKSHLLLLCQQKISKNAKQTFKNHLAEYLVEQGASWSRGRRNATCQEGNMKEGYMDPGEDVAKINVFLLSNGEWGYAS